MNGRSMNADNVQFDGRGEDGEKSAADRRRPHMPVFLAAMSDIVFATVTGTFYCFARQQVEVLPDQRRDPRILKLSLHQGVQQPAHGSRSLDGILLQRAGQQFHAVKGRIHCPEIKDQGRICPRIFHVDAHQCYFSAAGEDGVEPGLQAVFAGSECSHTIRRSVAKTSAYAGDSSTALGPVRWRTARLVPRAETRAASSRSASCTSWCTCG